MDDASVAAIQELVASRAKVTVWLGTFVGLNDAGTGVFCDIANGDATGRVPAQVMTPYRPEVNEQVQLLAIDGKFYLVGPALPKPGQGTVVSVTSDVATLATDVGNVAATFNAGLTLSASQIVKILWSDGPHVVGVLSTSPTPQTPPPSPTPGAVRHVDVFTAIDAGTFSGGRWWQAQPWASDTTLGAWFYGSKIRDTLRGASVSKVEIWSSLAQRYGSSPNFATHPHASKPTSGPSVSSATPRAVADRQWIELPVAFGAFLASNVGGIALAHGGFNKFRSLAQDAQSGALRITSTY